MSNKLRTHSLRYKSVHGQFNRLNHTGGKMLSITCFDHVKSGIWAQHVQTAPNQWMLSSHNNCLRCYTYVCLKYINDTALSQPVDRGMEKVVICFSSVKKILQASMYLMSIWFTLEIYLLPASWSATIFTEWHSLCLTVQLQTLPKGYIDCFSSVRTPILVLHILYAAVHTHAQRQIPTVW